MWSVFAVLNRLRPDAVFRRVLSVLTPGAFEVGGFSAYCDGTDPRGGPVGVPSSWLRGSARYVGWEVSPYFRCFTPLFLVARLWENGPATLDIERLPRMSSSRPRTCELAGRLTLAG
jgi:hypothetical protein